MNTDLHKRLVAARRAVRTARAEPMSPAESALCDAVAELIEIVEQQSGFFVEIDGKRGLSKRGAEALSSHAIAAKILREGLTEAVGEPDPDGNPHE